MPIDADTVEAPPVDTNLGELCGIVYNAHIVGTYLSVADIMKLAIALRGYLAEHRDEIPLPPLVWKEANES